MLRFVPDNSFIGFLVHYVDFKWILFVNVLIVSFYYFANARKCQYITIVIFWTCQLALFRAPLVAVFLTFLPCFVTIWTFRQMSRFHPFYVGNRRSCYSQNYSHRQLPFGRATFFACDEICCSVFTKKYFSDILFYRCCEQQAWWQTGVL